MLGMEVEVELEVVRSVHAVRERSGSSRDVIM